MKLKKRQFLIDTDVPLIHLICKRNTPALIKLMEKYDCFTSVRNAIELYNAMGCEDRRNLNMLLYSIKIIGIHSRYALSIADLVNKSKNWNLRDALLVGIAIKNRIVLATFSAKKYLNYNDLKILKIT